MVKKIGIVASVALAAALALSPLAFADDGGHVYNHPEQECGKAFLEGVTGFLYEDSHNYDSHDGDCDQD